MDLDRGLSKEILEQFSFRIKAALPDWVAFSKLSSINTSYIKELCLFLKGFSRTGILVIDTKEKLDKLRTLYLFLLITKTTFISIDADQTGYIDYSLTNLVFIHYRGSYQLTETTKNLIKFRHRNLKVVYCLHDTTYSDYQDEDISNPLFRYQLDCYSGSITETGNADNVYLF